MPERTASENGAEGEFTLRYFAFTDDADDQAPIVLASNLLPQYGNLLSTWEAGHPKASNFRCGARNAVPVHGPMVFAVECEFSTNPAGGETEARYENRNVAPLNRRTEVSKSDRDIEVPFYSDPVAKSLHLNTAGDPFMPPLKTTERQSVYTVSWTTSRLSAWMSAEKKYINKDAVTIRGRRWDKETLLIQSVDHSDEVWESGVQYYKVTAHIVGWKRGWKRQILNAGLFELPAGTSSFSKRRRCRIAGEPVTEPVPLAKAGYRIPESKLAADPVNAPYYLQLAEFEPIRFGGIIPSMA